MDVDAHALPPVIDTLRLVLRPYRFDDLDEVFAYAADEEWARYLPVPQPYRRTDAVQFLARTALLDWRLHPMWAVVLEGAVVGGVNIRFTVEHRLGEMGWSLARGLWGRGYTAEATRAVIDAAFRTHDDLNRIRAMADGRNAASLRVMEKIGMRHEGTLRQNRISRGVLNDDVWYGILRSEWQAG